MPENQELNFEGVERQPLRTFTEKAYLDYSMYEIGRASCRERCA